MALGGFPCVKVVHTSSKHEGQVYIPEINFLLLVACVFVTACFKDTTSIGNAYGKKTLLTHVPISSPTSSFILFSSLSWKPGTIQRKNKARKEKALNFICRPS